MYNFRLGYAAAVALMALSQALMRSDKIKFHEGGARWTRRRRWRHGRFKR